MEFEILHGELYRKKINTLRHYNLEIPEAWKNPVFPKPKFNDIWQAFIDLTTERYGGNGIMPIPLSKIIWYCDYFKLDEETIYTYTSVIRQLDIKYIEIINIKQKEEMKKNESKPVQQKSKNHFK